MGKWAKNRQRKAAYKKANSAKPTLGTDDNNGERPKGYDIIPKENKKFEAYYKLQKIVPEDEWEQFMNSCRITLPATFRVAGSRSQAQALVHVIQNKFVQDILRLNTEEVGNGSSKKVEIFPLPWYPGNLAWQMNATRQEIRGTEAYCRLHNFLISETDSGNISRQETVSMIPTLVLGVQPHHKVLDMCAAPGSKTAQVIEFLHQDESRTPEGCVIANDVENKRCYMLVHQAKRLHSPALIVTNHDATEYPDIFQTNSDGDKIPVKFDRILCDVPCSGDGTMRKNLMVWKKWNPGNGIHLHGTQFRILRRGLELLDVNGCLVYSTCSLNPIENEAVVHRILKEADDCIELEDIDLPGLKSTQGFSSWTPCDKDMTPYSKFEDVPDQSKSLLRPSHFPPAANESAKFHLEKCIRITPHQQDTGGFFVARFKKLKALPWEKLPNADARIALSQLPRDNDGKPDKKIPKVQGFHEDPYIFMTDDNPVWKPIREFFQLDESIEASSLLTRSVGDRRKNLYFTTKLVKNIVESNDGYVKIVNTGVRTFARSDNKGAPVCEYRLASEGLFSIFPYVKSRIVKIPKEDLIILLLNNDKDTPPRIDSLSSTTQEAVDSLDRGSLILVVELQTDADGPKFPIEVIGWKGNASIRAYVAVNERVHYLRMCGEDVTKFEKNKYKNNDVSGTENGSQKQS